MKPKRKRGPSPFTQSNVEKLVRGARKAGMVVGRVVVEITDGGSKITAFSGSGGDDGGDPGGNPWHQ